MNPPGGLLLNWNNKPAPGWLPGDDVHSYGSVHRVELFKGFARQVTLENTASVMNRAATRDLRSTEVWPVIRAVLGSSRAPDARTAQAVQILDRWRTSGSSRLDRDLDGRVDDPGAAVMDAAFEPMANAVLRPVLGSRLLSRLARLHERDRAPYKDDVNGSSFGSGWYGYVDKDLRRLLGRPVRGRFGLRYCGRGSAVALPGVAVDGAAPGHGPARRGPGRQPRGVALGRPARADRLPARPAAQHRALDQPAHLPAGARVRHAPLSVARRGDAQPDGQPTGLFLPGLRHMSLRAGLALLRMTNEVYLPIRPGNDTRTPTLVPLRM